MKIPELSALDYCRSGKALESRGRFEGAIACFKRAITLEPKNAIFRHLLGHALWRAKWFADAEIEIKRSIELDPEYFGNYHVLGSIYSDQGLTDEAIDAYDVALSKAPKSPAIKLDRALTLLLAGKLQTGFREYEARREHLADNYRLPVVVPRWEGQDLIGKTVLAIAEQGIGDIIQFSRYLPWLAARCERVIFLGPLELAPLFDHWPKHVITYVARGHWIPKADYHVYLGSLPVLHGTGIALIPDDPGFFRQVADSLARAVPEPPRPALKVGICWAGNPVHGRDRDRSVPLEHFLDLAADPELQLYSFQVGRRAGDIDLVGAQPLIYDLSEQLTDWGQTAAALTEMDLVISVDSAVAHLAAALGLPTWILLSKSPDWRWMLDCGRSPWYPTVSLWRQNWGGDWKSVFEQIEAAIEIELITEAPGPEADAAD